MKRLTLILFALLSLQPFLAQGQEIQGGPMPLYTLNPKTIKKTKNGNVLVAGLVANSYHLRDELFLLKCDSQGDVLWFRTYPYEAGDNCSRLALSQLVGGEWLVALRFSHPDRLDGKEFVMKIDQEGKKLWAEYFPCREIDKTF